MKITEYIQVGTKTVRNYYPEEICKHEFDGTTQDDIVMIEEYVEVPKWDWVEREMTPEEEANWAGEPYVAFSRSASNELTTEKKLELLLKSIPTAEKPEDCPGFIWEPVFYADGSGFGWQKILDVNYTPDGSNSMPYVFTPYMIIECEKWYTNGTNTYKAIVNGEAAAFTRPWFDVT